MGSHKVVGYSFLAGKWQFSGPAPPDDFELLARVSMSIPCMANKGRMQIIPESTVLTLFCFSWWVGYSQFDGHNLDFSQLAGFSVAGEKQKKTGSNSTKQTNVMILIYALTALT